MLSNGTIKQRPKHRTKKGEAQTSPNFKKLFSPDNQATNKQTKKTTGNNSKNYLYPCKLTTKKNHHNESKRKINNVRASSLNR